MSPFRWTACLALLAAATIVRADYQVTLSNVHVCCKGCVRDAKETGDSIPGASVTANKDTRSMVITANSEATAQKTVDALVAAGFYGTSSDPAIRVIAPSGDDKTVTNLKVSGVHLCCNHCVSDLNKAVAKVKGVTGTTAEKEADSFQISGTFNEREVIDALHAAGFSAQIE